MRKLIIFAFLWVVGCSSTTPHKEELQAGLTAENTGVLADAGGAPPADLAQLQAEVAEFKKKIQDQETVLYGVTDKASGKKAAKRGAQGFYGDLRSCRRKLASRQYGGNGTLVWSEPEDRLSEREFETSEKPANENLLWRERWQRHMDFNMILQERVAEFQRQITECKTLLASKTFNPDESSKVVVVEEAKTALAREEINRFMCQYSRPGASLQRFMLSAFGRGWLSLTDFPLEQNLLAVSIRDKSGKTKSNGFMFNGWKLAFDEGPLTLKQMFDENRDVRLRSWTYSPKADVAEAPKCLSAADGEWNQ